MSPRFNGPDPDHWRSLAAGRAAQLNAATLARIARAPGLTTHALAVGTTLAARSATTAALLCTPHPAHSLKACFHVKIKLGHGQLTIMFVVLSVCLFVCAEFFSAVFDPISMLYVWV